MSNLEVLECQVDELEKELEGLTTKAEETMQTHLNSNWENRAKKLEEFSRDFKHCNSCNSSQEGDETSQGSQKRLVSSFKRYKNKLRGSFKEKMEVTQLPIKLDLDEQTSLNNGHIQDYSSELGECAKQVQCFAHQLEVSLANILI